MLLSLDTTNWLNFSYLLQVNHIFLSSITFPLPLTQLSIFQWFFSISCPSIFSQLISHPSIPPLVDPAPWPSCCSCDRRFRRLRQRLSVTPTGSQRCLAVVSGTELKLRSGRRGGGASDAPTVAWACPFLSGGQRRGPFLPLIPYLQVTNAIVVMAAIRAHDAIIIQFYVATLQDLC